MSESKEGLVKASSVIIKNVSFGVILPELRFVGLPTMRPQVTNLVSLGFGFFIGKVEIVIIPLL